MYVREFHKYSGRVMVATPSMRDELDAHGFKNLAPWSRGVDTDLFIHSRRKEDRGPFKGMALPIWLNVGRVAVEKNIAAFVETPLPGTKVVVGDGPQLEALKKARVHFAASKRANSRPASPTPMSSSSRASPTRSASSSWNTWRQARRSPVTRRPAHATSSPVRTPARWMTILA